MVKMVHVLFGGGVRSVSLVLSGAFRGTGNGYICKRRSQMDGELGVYYLMKTTE